MLTNLNIVSPFGEIYNSKVKRVDVYTTVGQLGILPKHVAIAAKIEISELKIIDQYDKCLIYAISGGILHVDKEKITILSSTIELSSDIDINRASEAKKRAQDRLDNAISNTDLQRAEIALKKAINRINIAGKYR